MRYRRRASGLLAPEEGLAVPRLRGARGWDPASLGTLVGAKPPSQTYIEKVLTYSPIAYWPLNETSGTTADNAEGTAARDGTYVNTPTLNQTGIGDGNGAPLFTPASAEYVNVQTASLASAFSGAAGTLHLWCKVSASGVWTDGSLDMAVRLFADSNNYVNLYKNTTNNQLFMAYKAGGTAEQVSISSVSTTDWFAFGVTWSKAAEEVKLYLNGSQSGATQTSLGTWAGSLGTSRLGDDGFSSWYWNGYLAHAAVFTSPLGSTAMAALATVP